MTRWYEGRLDYQVEEMPGCCGIGVVTNLFIETDPDPYGDYGWDDDEDNERHKLSQIAVSSEIKRMTTEIKPPPEVCPYYMGKYRTYILTITDEEKAIYAMYDTALRNQRWTLINTSKTRHDGKNYNIYLYQRTFTKKKKKKKSAL